MGAVLCVFQDSQRAGEPEAEDWEVKIKIFSPQKQPYHLNDKAKIFCLKPAEERHMDIKCDSLYNR